MIASPSTAHELCNPFQSALDELHEKYEKLEGRIFDLARSQHFFPILDEPKPDLIPHVPKPNRTNSVSMTNNQKKAQEQTSVL